MKKKKLIAIIGGAVAAVIVLTTVLIVALAGKSGKKDAIWIMAEEMSGLFNPFYATAGADHDVVGMTQIGMLSTDYINGEPVTVAGDEYSTVVKAFSYEYDKDNDETVYRFVIKNGLKFSDGKPLTMNDVMFNIYEYLDPVYTGSSTMYSTKIKGLADYRAQKHGASADDDSLSSALSLAKMRRNELDDIYRSSDKNDRGVYKATPAEMYKLIDEWTVSNGYKDALGNNLTEAQYKEQLKKDYDLACTYFKEEIVNDYKASKDSFDFENAPYKDWTQYKDNEVFKFFLYEGYVKVEYGIGSDNKKDLNKIVRFTDGYSTKYTTEAEAVAFVQNDKIENSFNDIITGWGTANKLLTRFEADAKSILLQNSEDTVENISGIVSLGHTTDVASVSIKKDASNPNLVVGGDEGEYKVAKKHNKATGEPENANEYDVLQITIEKVDPKAIYNFGFTVAPQHYYATDDNGKTEEVDIANNKFGLKFANNDFQNNVIQSQLHVSIPVGAGPYKATDKDNSDNPKITEFNKDNTVYFKANHNFMFDVKCEKIQYKVVSQTNAIESLKKGDIDYITPQLTQDNYNKLTDADSKNKGISVMSEWQLGYGYIGINAGKVPNIYVRRAIMAAMDISLAKSYYRDDAARNIHWPMSYVSWAYPKTSNNGEETNNSEYTYWIGEAEAKSKITGYMSEAGVSAGSEDLKITFTIAGSSITEHPTYNVFANAAEILNGLGWEIEVKPDSQALTKLSTGSLAVWAAAWGSTIDPDMYQVYHKDSSATSTLAWGYREIFGNETLYSEEISIINELSELIEKGRETLNQDDRKVIYKDAMNKVLELAVEMPVYQRKNLFAYNSKTVKGFSEVSNPYSSPLEKIWELELA